LDFVRRERERESEREREEKKERERERERKREKILIFSGIRVFVALLHKGSLQVQHLLLS
jgi:hypothetical protein